MTPRNLLRSASRPSSHICRKSSAHIRSPRGDGAAYSSRDLRGRVHIPGFEIEAELGHGAYSFVYRARYGATRCALKVPREKGRWTRWMYREAVALARVRDPGLPA